MGRFMLIGRRSQRERCAICHDTLGEQETACAGCGSKTHADCRRELGRCATLGCAAEVAPPGAAGPRADGRTGPYSRIIIRAAAATVALAMGLVCLLWPVLSWGSFSAAVRGASLGSLALGAAYSFAMFVISSLAAWTLVRTPSLILAVKRLLDSTEPVALWLSVQKSETGVFHATLEETLNGSGKSVSLPIDASLAPEWVFALAGHHRAMVFGLETAGPCVLGVDGRLALVRGLGSRPAS